MGTGFEASAAGETEKSVRGAKPLDRRERRQSAPGRSDMATLRYAGIGARATPANVLRDMTVMAEWLARTGWTSVERRCGRGRQRVRGGNHGGAADDLAAVAGL